MTVGLVARSGHSLRAADAAWWTRAIHSRCKAHTTRPRAHRRGTERHTHTRMLSQEADATTPLAADHRATGARLSARVSAYVRAGPLETLRARRGTGLSVRVKGGARDILRYAIPLVESGGSSGRDAKPSRCGAVLVRNLSNFDKTCHKMYNGLKRLSHRQGCSILRKWHQ